MTTQPMDMQEIFVKVSTHLFNQGRQSKNSKEQNRYRGPKGMKCAVGVLIPDELYHPSMEGFAVDALCRMYPETMKAIIGDDPDTKRLVISLQHAHDFWCNWQSSVTLRLALKRIAAQYKLRADFLDSLSFKRK